MDRRVTFGTLHITYADDIIHFDTSFEII